MIESRRRVALIVFAMVALVLVGIVWFAVNRFCSPPYPIDMDPVVGRRVWAPFSDFPEPPKNAPQLDGWPVIGAPVSVPADLAKELREVLLSHSTYIIPDLSDCFEPGMAVSFGDGPNRVDAVICLSCEQAEFFCNGSSRWRRLSPVGDQRLKSIYERMFPPPGPK